MKILALLKGQKFMWILTFLGMLFFGPIGALAGLPGLAIDALIQRRARAAANISDDDVRGQNPYLFNSNTNANRPTHLLLAHMCIAGSYAVGIYALNLFGFGPVKAWISFTAPFADMLAELIPAFDYYSRLFADNGRWAEIAVMRHTYSAFLVFIILQMGSCAYVFEGSVSGIISRLQTNSDYRGTGYRILLALSLLLITGLTILFAIMLYLGFPLEKYMGPEQVPGSFLWPFFLLAIFPVWFSFMVGALLVAFAKMALDKRRSRRGDTA